MDPMKQSKSQTAWRTAAQYAELAQEADDQLEREYYVRMRNAWITLADRCEFFNLPDVTAGRSSAHAPRLPEQAQSKVRPRGAGRRRSSPKP
jgi:hypothetical protein